MARPIQSGSKNKITILLSSDGEGTAVEETRLEAAPRMILDRAERTHVFQDVPDDIRLHFNACFLLGETPYETAKIYGVLARVSHAHQAEVASLLRAPGNEEVCLVSTAIGLSSLSAFSKLQLDRKRKLAALTDALVTGITHVKIPLALFKSKTFLGVILCRVLASPVLQQAVLDFSAETSPWMRKNISEIKPFDVQGDWEHQQLIFTHLVRMSMPVQRQIKIDLVFRNRVVEPYNLNVLVDEGAAVLSCLRKLDINGLGVSCISFKDNVQMKQWGRLISMATALEELDLGDSIIDSSMLDILTQGLNAHPALRILSLQNNILCHRFITGRNSPQGWSSLMQILPDMPKLELIDLRGNHIDDIAADSLLDALNFSLTIQHIKLGQNKIHKRHLIWLDSRVSNA